jgi:hypothetical protein
LPGCRRGTGDKWCDELHVYNRGMCPWRGGQAGSGAGLKGMLEKHAERVGGDGGSLGSKRSYNELVLDDNAWARHLPAAIDAVFFFEDGESREHAQHVRDAFVAEFGLSRSQVPLLHMHIEGSALANERPFTLAEPV